MAIIGGMMGAMGGGGAAAGASAGAGGAAASGGASAGAGAASGGFMANMSNYFKGQGTQSQQPAQGAGIGDSLNSIGGVGNNPFMQAFNGILNSAGSYLQEKAMASALDRQQKKQWRAMMANTREQYRQQGEQMAAAAADNAKAGLTNQMSLAETKATVELMAAASGTGGGSITSMLTDLNAQGGRNQAQIVENYERQNMGFANQLKGIQSRGQMVMRKFEKPKLFNMFLTESLKAGGVAAKSQASQNQTLN